MGVLGILRHCEQSEAIQRKIEWDCHGPTAVGPRNDVVRIHIIGMTETVVIVFTVLLVGIGVAVVVRRELRQHFELQQKDQSMLLLNQNIQAMQGRIDATTKAIGERLDTAARVISGVSKELGSVQEMGRSMKELQDFLRSPKLRGNIGEQILRDLLEQYFAREHFDIQHKFRDGQVVDAIIKTDKGMIPIDSKFPMENIQKMLTSQTDEDRALFQREFIKDVKKHMTDISKKYILPAEGTVDFAVMYVPSESVYYELVRSPEDINAFGYEKRGFPVSPNSFYYFLKVLLLGMEGKKVEEASRKILETLRAIQSDAVRFGDTLGVLTTHVTNAKAAVDRVNNEYAKLSGKIEDVRLLR